MSPGVAERETADGWSIFYRTRVRRGWVRSKSGILATMRANESEYATLDRQARASHPARELTRASWRESKRDSSHPW